MGRVEMHLGRRKAGIARRIGIGTTIGCVFGTRQMDSDMRRWVAFVCAMNRRTGDVMFISLPVFNLLET